MCSICVTYARPFTDSGGVGMISQKLKRYTDPSFPRTHEAVWDARKRFYMPTFTDASAIAISNFRRRSPLQKYGSW